MDLSTAIFWLTLTLYKEARGEEPLDQTAVAHVILNRAKRTGESIEDIVLKPYQFSCYNQGVSVPEDTKGLLKVKANAMVAMNGHDFTGGAEFYHNTSVRPKWADSYERVGEFGNHIFYRR